MESLICGNTIDERDGNEPAINQFNLALKTKCLRPKVIVTYDRCAYVCANGNVRITFDRNVRKSEAFDLFGNPDLYHTPIDSVPEYNDILEVKYDEYLPSYIADTLEIGNMWQISFSKYALCREATICQ